MSTDPFDALAEPLTPLGPDPAFAAGLRHRLEARLTDATPGADDTGASITTTDPTDLEDPMPTADVVTTEPIATLSPLVPYLTCSPAREAIAWYGRVFGATVVGDTYPMGPNDDRVGHAELRIGDSSIYLSDEFQPVGAIAPTTLGGATTAFVLQVPDADAIYERAVDAGATADRPPADQTHGMRSGWFIDPFGHRWSIQAPLQN